MMVAIKPIEELDFAGYFIFHGLRIAVRSDQADILAAVQTRLRHFIVNKLPGPAQLTLEFQCVPESGPPLIEGPAGPTRLVCELGRGEIVYSDSQDLFYLNFDSGFRALCNPGDGYTHIAIPAAERANLWRISHPLFKLPFVELLKRRGRYSIHAAGLCIDGHGLLFPGTSGAGKSTLTLALLRAGFGLLGDDTLFLVPGEKSVQALAFPDEVDATERTLGLFPELQPLLEQPRVPGWPKRQLAAEQFYSSEWVPSCVPKVLVFPRVSGAATSVLRPLSRDEALFELVPNVLLTEARSSQAHLDALAALIRQCDCYRLETGQDFDTLPERLRELVGA